MQHINEMVEVLGKLDATNCSSEEAIAEFILNTANSLAKKNRKAFVVTAIQAYAKLLQDNGVKVD